MTDLLDHDLDLAAAFAERLRARYRRDDTPHPPAWNDTLDLLLAHRSVRAFRRSPLPAGALEAIVGAAQSAPSSSNLQVWSVVAVEDRARKERLADLAAGQRQIREAPLFLVWLIDLYRLTALAEERGGPHGALSYLEMFLLGATDTAMAAQNATVALESLGLGACYIGAIRNHPAEVAAELGLPKRVFPLVGMAVGWPDPDRPADVKPRLPQTAVLHREQYGAARFSARTGHGRTGLVTSDGLAHPRRRRSAWPARPARNSARHGIRAEVDRRYRPVRAFNARR